MVTALITPHTDTRMMDGVRLFCQRWLAARTRPAFFAIVHQHLEGASVLDTLEVGADSEAEAIAQEIEQQCHHHCDTTNRGSQRYEVLALAADKDVRATYPFRLHPHPSVAGQALSDPPNLAGVVGMMMRHLENRERLSNVAISTVLGNQDKQLERLQSRCEELEGAYIQAVSTFEDLVQAKHDRELEIVKTHAEQERRDRLFRRAEDLVPVMIAFASGSTAAAEFLRAIPPEVFDQLNAAMTDEQREKLSELMATAKGGKDAMSRFMEPGGEADKVKTLVEGANGKALPSTTGSNGADSS